ncbi:Thioredoxin [Pseudobythopirellula maris]|uniref:Thioredoxin n=1 Tax=Pseudobythopirellula maris TaxID=2527991 RepID=A0A5C5ZV17_9BACT|nr:thioredoxin fold domain-containing protein [Pseudobythopirellula maris]TWT90878.1 Thioredoxin [Pseudobythopirellula maris]
MRTQRIIPLAIAIALLVSAPLSAQETTAPETSGGFSLRSLFGLAPAEPAPLPGLPIAWSNDAGAAQADARQSRRPIVAYVTSENCRFCRKMELETWTDESVAAEVTRRFVPLKLHAERDSELVQALKVRAFPTTIVFTPEGKAVGAATGFLPPEKLAGLLRTAGATPQAMAPRPAVR